MKSHFEPADFGYFISLLVLFFQSSVRTVTSKMTRIRASIYFILFSILFYNFKLGYSLMGFLWVFTACFSPRKA